jgi:hypothetical protein
MIHNAIYAILIRLSAEPDYQNFLIRFKQKLFYELHRYTKTSREEQAYPVHFRLT